MKPFGKTGKEICKLKIYDRPLIYYLLNDYRKWCNIYEILVDQYQAPILYRFSLHHYMNDTRIEGSTVMKYIAREIEETKGKAVGSNILLLAFSEFLFSESNLDTLIELLKRYRLRDFKPKFLKRYIYVILNDISRTYNNFALKLNYIVNKLKVVEIGYCGKENISDCIVEFFDKHVGSETAMKPYYKQFLIEMNEMKRLGLGCYFNKLPEPLVSCIYNTDRALRLVIESGIDLKNYPYLIYRTLERYNIHDQVKLETLKFLIDECKLEYNIPEGENEVGLDYYNLNTATIEY